MKDQLLIATAFNGEARIYVSYTKKLTNDARIIHETWPTATAALGRLLTAGAMMSYFNKDDSTLMLKIEGDGPIKSLEVQSNTLGELRATISNPEVYLKYSDTNKLAVGKAIGSGTLSVIRNMGLKRDYRSTVSLVSGEIADDLTYYFTTSEQTPSSVGLGVLVDNDEVLHAGGFIIQLLPDVSEKTIVTLEKILKDFTSVTDFYSKGHSPFELLNVLSNNTYKLLDEQTFIYNCPCSKEYYYKMLKKLDHDTITSFIEEDGGAEVVCHYCKKKYHFNVDELNMLLKDKK